MLKEKKEIIQEQFQNFLSQKYCKQFHIVDNPALSFSLAKKSGVQEQTYNAYNNSIQESMKKTKYFQTEKQKSNIRKFYDNLKTHASIMIESIQNCLDQGKFALSQFFQYYQLVLAGFLKSFIEQLTSECRQKGQFLQFIWSQNIKLVYKMLNFYQRSDYKSEMKKNRQLYETHTKYSDFMQKQAEKLKQKSRQIQKMKSIIEIMVQKLRIRRKQVKKLFKETKQLDKNTELQYKFLSLIQSKNGYDEVQMKEISEKKERLNNVYQQIITIQKALYKNTNPINHELNIEGPFQIEDFIKQAGEAIHSTATNQEVKAEIQVIFGRVQEDFEDTLLRIKKVNKKRMLNCDLNLDNNGKNYKYQSYVTKPDCQSVYSQFNYYQKKDHDFIKNIGVQVNGQSKQISYKNYSVQFNSPVWKYKNFNIYKTVDCKLRNQTRCKPQKKDLTVFVKQLNQLKQIQTQQIKNELIEELEEEQSEQDFHRTTKIMKKKKLQKHKKGIKSRFSLFQASSRKISKTVEGKINIEHLKQQSVDNQKQNPRSFSTNMIQKYEKRTSSIDFSSRLIKQKKNIKSKRTTSFQNFRSSIFQQNKSQSSAQEGQGKFKKQSKKTGNNFSRFSKMNNFKMVQNHSGIQNNERRKKLNSKVYHKVEKITNQVIKQVFQVFNSNYKVLQDFDTGNLSQKQKPQSFPNGIMEHLITQTIKRKAYKKVSLKSSERHHLLNIKTKQIKWQVNKLIKNCNLKQKRMPSQAKKNYLWNIIQSVYSRTYQKMDSNSYFYSFIQPLYETLIILYGSLPKQEIDKKMINFISQISYYKKDHICKSFLFFLSMDDDEKICQIISHSDITLYLKLIKKISHLQKAFQDISRATTNYQRLQQIVPVVFREQKLSLKLADHILKNIEKQINEGKYRKDSDQNMNEKDEPPEKKLNLFYCSMTIVKQMIMVRINLKKSFLPFLSQLTETDAGVEKQEEREYQLNLQMKSIQRIVRIFSKTKIEQIKFLDNIQKIPKQESRYININYFSSVMMVLEVTNLQDYYIKVLNKFNINKQQKRRCLLANRYKQNRKNQREKNLTKEASDLLTLQIAENKSDLVLEYILGKQLTQLTTLIVLLISEI